MSSAVLAVSGVAVAGLTWVFWKLFLAPIVPRGFESFLTIPHDPKSVTRLGKWIGDLPYSDFQHNHHQFRDLVRKYGPIVRKRVLTRNVVILGNITFGSQVLKDREHFLDRGYTGIREIIPHGILSLDTNEEWTHHRRAVSPMFAERFMKIYARAMCNLTHVLQGQLEMRTDNKSIDMRASFMALSLDILGVSGFGCDFDAVRGKGNDYVVASEAVLHAAIAMTVMPQWLYKLVFPKDARAYYAGRELFRKAVEKSLQELGDETTHMLAQLHKAGLSGDELMDELLTIVFAGHETTANTMSWFVYLMTQNPEIVKKLQQEIDALYNEPGFEEENMYEHRHSLPYLKACIYETLRMFPTVPVIPRVCTKATQIGGYDIFPGAIVFTSSFAAFRNPEEFPEPEKFDPTRFLNEKVDSIDGDHFFAFGAGQRICPGRRFAMLEMMSLLTMMYRNFDIELDKNCVIDDQSHITLTPANGVQVFLHPRARN